MNNLYRVSDPKVWTGRIDSNTNFDAFRWHQWIEILDLKNIPKDFDKSFGFAIIGFKCDKGVKHNKGRAGAKHGPVSIRKELRNLPCRFDKSIKIYDAGDILQKDAPLEDVQASLSWAVEQIKSLNLFPIILGGGHEVALGSYNGLLNYALAEDKNDPKIGIINFDAHFDIRPYTSGGTSGTMFRQIYDQCHKQTIDYSYFVLGIQKSGNTIDLFKTADKIGANYILAKDMVQLSEWSIIEKLDDFITNQKKLHLTICSDVFSSAFAPGVSSAQPLGLHPEKVLTFIKYIIRTNKLESFDIAEVSPRFDFDNSTANLASLIIFTLINTLSKMHMNKQ